MKQGKRVIDLSIPALRTLGIELGYYPLGDYKACGQVDMVAETYSDVFDLWANALLNQETSNEQKAEAFNNSLAEGTGAAWKLFNLVTTVLDGTGKKFIGGDKPSIADCCMTSLLFNFVKNDQNPMSQLLKPTVR